MVHGLLRYWFYRSNLSFLPLKRNKSACWLAFLSVRSFNFDLLSLFVNINTTSNTIRVNMILSNKLDTQHERACPSCVHHNAAHHRSRRRRRSRCRLTHSFCRRAEPSQTKEMFANSYMAATTTNPSKCMWLATGWLLAADVQETYKAH